ncbi:polyketide synthase [Cytophagales bacterium WSM2-2]|nr:polyketide synthase [Cytophagales bacterium WSM2-2]
MNNQDENGKKPVDPIAIVGMSCRFPSANTLEEFWNLLSQGKDTITDMSSDRWEVNEFYDPDLEAANKTNQRHASFLKNIHDFDPLFFNISPAEATEMNPSQKLMLELVWEAIENSSIAYKKMQGTKTGVYVGNIWNDFEHLRKRKNANATSHSAVGQSSNIIANRVSFSYGFTGPSLVVDTGCSSSLVALHLACQSLWDESTEACVVAGINHILDPDQYVLLSKFGGLSSNGRCSTFDINGDGFVRGEGAGVLILKRLTDAERDNDKIVAIIRGTAMNNNGYNVNLPATSTAGQLQVLHDAYATSGINPGKVHYVEAHGTGTKLGDPTEARALGEFFREGRNTKLHIGSVKTNIGHLEAAAGIAGLIKVVLAMKYKQLPPSLNFKTPNPNIAFEELKLQVQAELGTWPTENGETLKAGINSFGWGGTNAHTIIEEYRKTSNTEHYTNVEAARYTLPLSAKSGQALKDYAKAFASALQNASEVSFRKICIATALLKPRFDHHALFTATDKSKMIEALTAFAEEDEVSPHKLLTADERVVMIFPGQGSQWFGMGCELYDKEPVFRKAIEDCNSAFSKYIDWSLTEQLFTTAGQSGLKEINVIQPALCAVQIAMARLWMSWGIIPDAIVGHSMGEVAAAHISGALNLDDAARIICTRSRLMKTVSGKGGAMAVTELSVAQAEELIKPYSQISVAVSNSPKSTVLSGQDREISRVIAELDTKGLFARLVKVDVASHSQQMDVLKENLREALREIKPVASVIPMYSTVRSKKMEGSDLDSDYWVDNLRQTVQFAPVMEKLMLDKHVVFIEVSPHPVLINAVNECADHLKKKIITIDSTYREKPEHDSIYKNLAELYSRGYAIDWSKFYQTDRAPDIALPSYPFQRERFELEDHSHEQQVDKKRNSRFPLLGNSIQLAGDDNTFYWETQISLNTFPYLQDHQVNETPVLPGAAYVEMLLEAAGEIYQQEPPVITNLRFIKSISLSKEEQSTIQLKLIRNDRINKFQFFLKVPRSSGSAVWELLSEGELKINMRPDVNHPVVINDAPVASLVTGTAYYESLKSLGLQYGTYFQGVKELRKVITPFHEEIRFDVEADQRIISASDRYKIHPALLDAFFQPLFFSVFETDPSPNNRTTFLVEVGGIEWLNPIDSSQPLYGTAVIHPAKKDEHRGFINVEAEVTIYDSSRIPMVRITGLKGKIIDTSLIEQRKEKLKNWLYKVSWVKQLAAHASVNSTPGKWVIFGDPYGVSDILTERMRIKGFETIQIIPANGFFKSDPARYSINYGREEDYRALIEDLFAPAREKIDGIIHIGSMSYTWQDPYLTADVVEHNQIYGSISFMYLHQQLTALKLKDTPQLVIVTNGIQTISKDQDVGQPVHSPLWGMAKVMFNELTHFNCRCFDLSANPSMEELNQVVAQLSILKDTEHEIAFRGTDQYVPRLGMHVEEELPTNEPKEFSSTGTYLVTGFRGLGFVFIEWMIRQGARNFALVSRTGDVAPEMTERMSLLEYQGCRFKIFKADTGVYNEIRDVMDVIEVSMPELKGVIHAAGVIEARTLTELNQKEFLRILNPKVKGAWNLHLLTQHKSLDCFIMFSSASTLIGLSGQGSYVAANAFLDTLAHSRRRMGLPGMSVNWGVMKDVGMVANKSELEKYAKAEGFEPVSMKDAMEVFNAIYDSEYTQIGIVKIHAETMASYYSELSRAPYFKGLLVQENKVTQNEASFLDKLAAAESVGARIVLLENLVAQWAAKITKTSSSRIKPTMTFKGLGIDSLMAIQLRNLLEKSLNLKLSVAMFWTHPSIQEYATFLSRTLAEQLLIKNLEGESLRTSEPNPLHWFVTPQPRPDAAVRVFCFHDAGGNASLYHSWPDTLGDQLELVAIELPGRGRRMNEKPYSNLQELIHDLMLVLTPLLDKPFVFFGHSMGGLIAFELARALNHANLPKPSRLFISSTPGLTTYTRQEVDPSSSDEALVRLFPHLNRQNINDDELHQVLVGLMRTDLHLLNNYSYRAEKPIDIPLTIIYGTEDERVKTEQADHWKNETSTSCTIIPRPGGHRYIDHDAVFLTALITSESIASTPVKSLS